MRVILPVLVSLSACSMPQDPQTENANIPVPANASSEHRPGRAAGSSAVQVDVSGADAGPSQPYLAVRKTSGPALQALMTGRLEIQGDCVVFVEPGGKPRLAVFHPPASVTRRTGGAIVVSGSGFEVPIGREVRVGGGALPPGADLGAALRAPVGRLCPQDAVEIGELVP